MTNISIDGPEAVLALLVTHAKNFVHEGLGKLLSLRQGRDEVINRAVELLKDARAYKTKHYQELEAYEMLIDFLRRHLESKALSS